MHGGFPTSERDHSSIAVSATHHAAMAASTVASPELESQGVVGWHRLATRLTP